MTQIALPSGQVIDFGDVSDKEIESALSTLQKEEPSLFMEKELSEEDFIKTLSFDEAVEYGRRKKGDRTGSEEFQPTHKGEVKDLGLSYFVGRGDTDEERLRRLSSVFGTEGVEKIGPDDFILQLDNISSDVKAKYNLPETGTIRFNEPGLGWQDVASFMGRETVPLIGALGAGVAATGMGALPGIALVGAAGAAGKAIDEFIFEDIFEGLQAQSTEEILKDVALQALIEGGGEGVGRAIVGGAKWALKGSGPAPDSTRVSELRDVFRSQGMSEGKANKLARKAASEEASALYRSMIDEGANVPAVTLTGKSILGRTQAIWESIFPNDVAVSKNVDYVRKILADEKAGRISTDEAKAAIGETAESLVALLRQSLADPKAAAKQANKELKDVLEKEFDSLNKVLENSTAGSQGLATEFQQGLDIALKLFTARSNQLYRNADALLEGETISAEPLKALLNSFRGPDAALTGGDNMTGGIWSWIDNTEQISISQIPALRNALRATESDPALIGTPAGRNIKQLLDTIDESVNSKVVDLTQKVVDTPSAWALSPAEKELRKAGLAQNREGIELLKQANKHYSDGAEIINSGQLKSLNLQIKDKFIQDMTGIVDQVVRPNQPQLLKGTLDAIQPSGEEVNLIIKTGQENEGLFKELAAQIREGDIVGVNQRLDALGLSNSSLEKAGIKKDNILLRVPEVFTKLPKDDASRIRLQEDYAEILDTYDLMSRSSTPKGRIEFREGFRDLMAKTWLNNARRVKSDGSGLDYASITSSFDALGPAVQKELFGSDALKVQQLMRDFKILGNEGVEKLNDFSGPLANQDLQTILDTFRGVVRQSEVESQDAFLRAMAGGPVDIDKLVSHVLKTLRTMKR